LIAVGAAAIVPLATLGSMLAPRHALVPSFVCSVLIAAALQRLSTLSPRMICSSLTAAFALLVVAAVWSGTTDAELRRSHARSVRHYHADGSFVLSDAPGALLMTTLNDVSYLSCMRDLRSTGAAVAGPGFCGDACFCARSFPENDRWIYDGERVVRGAPPARADCASARPVDADFRYDSQNGTIHWRAGPYADGRYEALLVFDRHLPAVSVPIPIPRRGDIALWLSEPLGVVVRYEGPGGWLAYSPLHELAP
jgi:hypothetical protein